jgi:hypothetical protein
MRDDTGWSNANGSGKHLRMELSPSTAFARRAGRAARPLAVDPVQNARALKTLFEGP